MSNFTPFPQPIDSGDGNLDRSQDEATFQREQRQAADAADAAERCHNHYTAEEVAEFNDYYGEATYEDYEPNPYDGTYSEM